ncbi:putative oxidoreductase YcjS [compost metagenome]
MKEVRIGIIGAGGIASLHARAYKQIKNVKIVAIADTNYEKAQHLINQLNISSATAYNNYQNLLDKYLDAVSICTPNASHHTIAIDALNAGKHVLVEKPMALTLDGAIEMVRTSKENEKMLSVGFQPRYDNNIQTVKNIVDSGQLGHVYYVQVGGGRRRGIPDGTFISKDLAGAGATIDIGCYSLDLALYAIGYPKPVTVSASTFNHLGTNPKYFTNAQNFEVEDFGVALIRFDTGQVLNFKISWAMHMDSLGPTLFLGTDAGLRITPSGSGPWGGVWDSGVSSITLFHDLLGNHVETIVPTKSHMVNIFYEKIYDFVTSIAENGPAPIPGEQIIRNQAILDGILRSSTLGKEVNIDIPEF